MKKILFILLLLCSLVLPSNSYAEPKVFNNFNIFAYPDFGFSGDFIAGSGIFEDDKKNLIPRGTISIWYKEQIPEGWLECNGQAVPSYYPELRKMMMFTPNFQGMFLRGAGSQIVNHGGYGSVTHGTTLGAIQGDTIRNIKGRGGMRGDGNGGGYPFPSGPFYDSYIGQETNGSIGYFGLDFDASRVVPTSNENRPINIGIKYIIKAE